MCLLIFGSGVRVGLGIADSGVWGLVTGWGLGTLGLWDLGLGIGTYSIGIGDWLRYNQADLKSRFSI